ncbi:MAG: phosphotransferase [Thiotrichales bacterium]|nr:phosphotransferase [Thiotrichales bacterium]
MQDRQEFDARAAALAGWLRDALGTAAFRIEPASEDASFRRYFRVRTRARTWVAMDAPPPMEDCRPFVSVLGRLRDAGVNAPRLHAADVERGFLLLDDLGSRCYLDVIEEANADALYSDAFEALLAMQGGIGRGQVPPYDERKLHEELDLFPHWFLAHHLGIELDGTLSHALRDTFEALVRACTEQPRVFVHRDYHSRNLMYLEDVDPGRSPGGDPADNPGVIDFQDAVDGPITYDLVSLLRDVYVRWPEDRVAGWVDAYHDRAVARSLLDVGRAQFHRWFDLTGVQRHLKIAGIFARLWHRDGKPRYLDDLPLTLSYLARIAPRYPETEAVVRVLEECDVANRMRATRPERPIRPRRGPRR